MDMQGHREFGRTGLGLHLDGKAPESRRGVALKKSGRLTLEKLGRIGVLEGPPDSPRYTQEGLFFCSPVFCRLAEEPLFEEPGPFTYPAKKGGAERDVTDGRS